MSLHIRKRAFEKPYRRLSFLIKNAFASREARREQAENCLLLHMLPTDVILQIAEYLPASSKVFLSHTCLALRNGLGSPTTKRLPLTDRIAYAGVLAKDQLDVRVCRSCGCLHSIRKHDSPTVQPRLKIKFRPYKEEDCRSMYEPRFPGERHVQLALKYTRLGTENPKHKEIFESILQPFVHTSQELYARPHHLKRWSWCKIVDGRFLVMTKWTMRRFYQVVSKSELGLAELLQLEKFRPYGPHSEFTFTGARACRSNCEGEACICEINQIVRACGVAHYKVGTPAYAWDLDSAADYAICLTRKTAETCTWEDLGGELPHLDEVQDMNTPGRHGYKPHGVRELFERDGKKWLTEEEFEVRKHDRFFSRIVWRRIGNSWFWDRE